MDAKESTPMEWPNVGNVVRFVNDDGSTSTGVISFVVSRGDYPIANVGVFGPQHTVDRWVKCKFDPDADRPGTWHYPPRGERP